MDTDLLKDVLAIILPLLVTWMFPQVLLNGVNPLIALNQSVNPAVFIVFHVLLSPNDLFGHRNRPKFPEVVEYVPSSSWDCFCLLLTEPFGLYQHRWRLCR